MNNNDRLANEGKHNLRNWRQRKMADDVIRIVQYHGLSNFSSSSEMCAKQNHVSCHLCTVRRIINNK